MRVQLQRDASASTFSKQLLDLGNERIPMNPVTMYRIIFPSGFCRMIQSKEEEINCVFPDIVQNFKIAIFLTKSMGIYKLKNRSTEFQILRMYSIHHHHNWPLQPFSQDHGLASHTTYVVCG